MPSFARRSALVYYPKGVLTRPQMEGLSRLAKELDSSGKRKYGRRGGWNDGSSRSSSSHHYCRVDGGSGGGIHRDGGNRLAGGRNPKTEHDKAGWRRGWRQGVNPSFVVDVEFIKTRQQQFARAVAILPVSLQEKEECSSAHPSTTGPTTSRLLPCLTQFDFSRAQLLTLASSVVMAEAQALPAGHALLPLLQTHMVSGDKLEEIRDVYRDQTKRAMQEWKAEKSQMKNSLEMRENIPISHCSPSPGGGVGGDGEHLSRSAFTTATFTTATLAPTVAATTTNKSHPNNNSNTHNTTMVPPTTPLNCCTSPRSSTGMKKGDETSSITPLSSSSSHHQFEKEILSSLREIVLKGNHEKSHIRTPTHRTKGMEMKEKAKEEQDQPPECGEANRKETAPTSPGISSSSLSSSSSTSTSSSSSPSHFHSIQGRPTISIKAALLPTMETPTNAHTITSTSTTCNRNNHTVLMGKNLHSTRSLQLTEEGEKGMRTTMDVILMKEEKEDEKKTPTSVLVAAEKQEERRVYEKEEEEDDSPLFSWRSPLSSPASAAAEAHRRTYRLHQLCCSIPAYFEHFDPYSLPNRVMFSRDTMTSLFDDPVSSTRFEQSSRQLFQVLRPFGKGRGPSKSISFVLQYLPHMVQDVLHASFPSSTAWWDFLGLLHETAREEVERANQMYREDPAGAMLSSSFSSVASCAIPTVGRVEPPQEERKKETHSPAVQNQDGEKEQKVEEILSKNTSGREEMRKETHKGSGGEAGKVKRDEGGSRFCESGEVKSVNRKEDDGLEDECHGEGFSVTDNESNGTNNEKMVGVESSSMRKSSPHNGFSSTRTDNNEGNSVLKDSVDPCMNGENGTSHPFLSSSASLSVATPPRVLYKECQSLEELSLALSRTWASLLVQPFVPPPSSPLKGVADAVGAATPTPEASFLFSTPLSDNNEGKDINDWNESQKIRPSPPSNTFCSKFPFPTRGPRGATKFYAYGSADNAVLKRTLALSCPGSGGGRGGGGGERVRVGEPSSASPPPPPPRVHKKWGEICTLPPLPRDRLHTPTQMQLIDITSHPMYAAAGFLTSSRKKISLVEALKKASGQDETAAVLYQHRRPHDPIWDAQALGCVVIACGVIRP